MIGQPCHLRKQCGGWDVSRITRVLSRSVLAVDEQRKCPTVLSDGPPPSAFTQRQSDTMPCSAPPPEFKTVAQGKLGLSPQNPPRRAIGSQRRRKRTTVGTERTVKSRKGSLRSETCRGGLARNASHAETRGESNAAPLIGGLLAVPFYQCHWVEQPRRSEDAPSQSREPREALD